MTASRKIVAAAVAVVALGSALLTGPAIKAATTTSFFRYEPITSQQLKSEAVNVFANAKQAGRLNAVDINSFSEQLYNAHQMPDVEAAWANIEASAQVAKNKHVSLNQLLADFQLRLNNYKKKGIVPAEGWKFYTDRIEGIRRVQRDLQKSQGDHVWLFWDWAALAIDLSSVDERLTRSIEMSKPGQEQFDDLLLRTDNYLARNDVAARNLTVYKSFEVEPEELQASKYSLYRVLTDRAHSRIETPAVRAQLGARLKKLHYEASRTLPSEMDINTSITEVQRLLDAGARNGHLPALDGVRIQHELELVKKLKHAYPGPNPGLDPFERELRMEEVRFMASDLRFLQDWLGRLLRQDGETVEAREQVLRVLRRTDLAYFSHRITHADAVNIMESLNQAIRTSNGDAQLAFAATALQGRLDMMVSDFSMVPAETTLRLKSVSDDVARVRHDKEDILRDLDHASKLVDTTRGLPDGPRQYGQSIVAASELELIRTKLQPILQRQH